MISRKRRDCLDHILWFPQEALLTLIMSIEPKVQVLSWGDMVLQKLFFSSRKTSGPTTHPYSSQIFKGIFRNGGTTFSGQYLRGIIQENLLFRVLIGRIYSKYPCLFHRSKIR